MDAEWRRGDGGEVRLDYDGPCLTFSRTDPFLDLETGLAEAELSHLRAELEFRPVAPATRRGESSAGLGQIEGRVSLGKWAAAITAPAALQDGPLPDTHPWRERRALCIPLGSDTFLSISSHLLEGEVVEGHLARDGRLEPLLSARVIEHNPAKGLAPRAWRIEAVSRSARLRVLGHVTHAIPVVRPVAGGRVLTVFGLARFGAEQRVGFGTFEQSLRLGQKGATQ